MKTLEQLAAKCASLSETIYKPLGTSPPRLEVLGVRNPAFISSGETDTNCIICEDDAYIYVVFEGTDSAQDVKQNLMFRQKETVGGYKIHRGFLDAWWSVAAEVNNVLGSRTLFDAYNGKHPKHVVFTGHSLGGAIAHVGAVLSRTETYALITFGAPPAGGEYFNIVTQRDGIAHVRVVNNCDPVPNLLFWNRRYFHSGCMWFLDEHFGKTINPTPWAYLKARLLWLWDWSDHSIKDYARKLHENI